MRQGRLFVCIFIVQLSCIFMQGCGVRSDALVSFSESQEEASCRVGQGKTLTVRLPANHTTGYVWRTTDAGQGEVVEHIRTEYVQDKSGLVGTGGVEVWEFRAKKRSDDELVFEYARPWEKDEAPVRVKRVRVSIR